MANLTVMYWNVEVFGDTRNAARGPYYVPVCNFVANVIHEADADIFFLMELRSGGVAYLDYIRKALNSLDGLAKGVNGWQYDYIPGAVIANQARPINNFNQLGYTQQGHSEGYAVFWRPNANKFTMLITPDNLSAGKGPGGTHNISLVLNGRPPNPFNGNYGWYTSPVFNPANAYAFGNLDFPVPKPIHGGDYRLDLCRRPAYAVVRLVNTQGTNVDKLLPMIVFHAPNSPASTRYGVQLCGYTRELYRVLDTTNVNTPTNINQAIVGGDFNINSNDQQNLAFDAYTVFTVNFAGSGANCNNIWVPYNAPPGNRTAVRLEDRNGVINTNTPTDYYWLGIDNLFYRNANGNINPVNPPANYNGPVFNLVAAVMQNGVLADNARKQTTLRLFKNSINYEKQSGNYQYTNPANGTPCTTRNLVNGNYVYSGALIPYLLNYGNFMTDLTNGYFTHARRAAEFIVNCISDHLPVVTRFQINNL
ncbi:MAG: hypothetical protein AB1757_24315 [Acidobacteriota bacterium]